MMRTILYLVLGIILVTFLRMVIGIVMRSAGEMLSQGGGTRPAQPGRSSRPSVSGALKRDPVCGTFVPASTEYRKIVNGAPVHFCSAECRDKYA